MNLKSKFKITKPKNQLNLYGYDTYFKLFINLYKKKKLPNSILLTGPKGLGKATFAYHFANYLLSENEDHKYSVEDYSINENNKSFKLLSDNTHPNFYLLDYSDETENIKMEQVRELLRYLNKTTYSKDIKVILLDNVEHLNLNSANALLKSLEETSENTFFFVINSDSSKLLDTIKSRCITFNLFFNEKVKKSIFDRICSSINLTYESKNLDKFLYFDTPGNLIRYLLILNNSENNILENDMMCILKLMDLFKTKKDKELLLCIQLFIEKFYSELSLKNPKNINYYTQNKNKILYLILNYNKFNLDKKNLLFSINTIIKNEE